MCYFLFHRESMTELEKNPRKHIEEQFRWLLESGHQLTYYFKNGENEFVFQSERSKVYLYYDVFDEITCEIAYGSPRHTHRFVSFPDDAGKAYYNALPPQDKIDFMSSRTKEILEDIDGQGLTC